MSVEDTINQARKWQFPVVENEGSWQILPSSSPNNWTLSEVEERWLLTVNNVPQTYLSDQEAIKFLKMRRYPGLYQKNPCQ